MARRVVSVYLELYAQSAMREVRSLTATTIASSQAVDELGDKADAASRDMDQLAVHTALAKHEVDDLGDKSRVTAADLRLLQSRIDAARLSARGLALEFARTGDTAVSAQLGKERAAVARLERAQKLLTPSGPGGGGLMAAIPSIGGVPGPLIAGGAAAAAGLAPFLGGIVAAAVLGGVGTGGVIGGIALASQDTRVKTEWKFLGRTVFAELSDAAEPFVDPLLRVASSWRSAWSQEAGPVRAIFTDLAKTVEPLGDGVAGFVHNLTPGLSNAVKASLPLAKQFSVEFENFGTSSSNFLDSMARSAPGATRALHDLFVVTDAGLEQLGQGVHALSETYEVLRRFGLVAPPEWLMQMSKGSAMAWLDTIGLAHDAWANLNNEVEVGHRRFAAAGSSAEGLSRELEDQTGVVADLEAKYQSLVETMLRLPRAKIDFKQSLADLSQSIADNGTTLDLNTQKGRDNARAFLDAAEAAVRQRDAMIKAGVDTATANKIMATSMQQVEDQAGRNRKAVHDMIAELEAVPAVTRAQLILEFSRIGLPGEHSGQRIADLVPHRAAGGDVLAGHPYWVGERGPEPFVPATNGTIYPANQSSYAAAAAGGTVRHVVDLQVNGQMLRSINIDEALRRGVPETTIALAYP